MSKKQAVLLIHGIGEQRPMDTLRCFVDAVWTTDTSLHNPNIKDGRDAMWSKPDTVSKSFELRRLTTPQNRANIRTDFFEFYWAHLMEGTGYGHVVAWMKTILLRSPASVPRHLLFAYLMLWLMVLTAIGFAVYAVTSRGGAPNLVPEWIAWVVSAVLVPIIGVVVKNIIGDAARYLHIAPTNIQRRHEIRQAGVELIKNLHDRGYDRIIVVGHSLGSVIGYDILTHAWPEYHAADPTTPNPADPKNPLAAPNASIAALENLETLAARKPTNPPKTIPDAQRDYFVEIRNNGNKWRVSDFVTLGSPLAHAEILLAADADALRAKTIAREFPSCLPALEKLTRNHQTVEWFSFDATSKGRHRKPHHAAVFAPTRWTNLYFPCTVVVHGDIVGGRIAPVLGGGVTDVSVETSLGGGFFTHTKYWTPEKGGPSIHVARLRKALDLADDARVTA